MKNKLLWSVIFLFIFQVQAPGRAEKKIKVEVSIPPLVEMAAAVGREKVSVTSFVTVGANPHTYEPRPQKLKEVSLADLFVKIGSGLESELMWLDKLTALNRKMKVCDSSHGIKLLASLDPHFWTSPWRAVVITGNICDSLIEIDPNNQNFYRKNAADYMARLKKLDLEIARQLRPIQGRSFIVFHPAWAYLAKDYDLKEIPIEIEGKEPTVRQMVEIIKQAQKNKVKVVFITPQFSQKAAEVIARQIKVPLVLIDNLAADYLNNTLAVVKKMRQFME